MGAPAVKLSYRGAAASLELAALHNKGSIVTAVAAPVGGAAEEAPPPPPPPHELVTVGGGRWGAGGARRSKVAPAPPTDQALAAGGAAAAAAPGAAAAAASTAVVRAAPPAAAGALDLGRWGDDDLDLREIIERLEAHAEVRAAAAAAAAVPRCPLASFRTLAHSPQGIRGGFASQSADTASLLAAVHAEADAIKRLLVRASFEHAAIASSGVDDGTRRHNVAAALSTELQARASHDRHVTQLETELLAAVFTLAEDVAPGPDPVAAGIVEQASGGEGRRVALVVGDSWFCCLLGEVAVPSTLSCRTLHLRLHHAHLQSVTPSSRSCAAAKR